MGVREVRVDGGWWVVWNVWPEGQTGDAPPGTQECNWLVMQRGAEKRRIMPAPKGWEEWTDGELADAVRGAPRVPARE